MAEALGSHDGLNLGDRPLGKGLRLGWRLGGTSGDLAMGQGGGGYGRPNAWQSVGAGPIAHRVGCKQGMASLYPKKYRPGGWVSLEYIPHPSPVGSTPPDVTKTGATSWWGRGK